LIGLIFCQVVISGELLALVSALVTAGVVSVNFIGGALGFIGDVVLTTGAAIALFGAAAAAGPAVLALLLALGLTGPFTLNIPIYVPTVHP
jgi:hypothetical protein